MVEAPHWSVIVHGGCKEIAPDAALANRAGMQDALAASASMLSGGASAVEAVEAAIVILEDDATFNAGAGSARRSDGRSEMDAAIMDGATLAIGGVCAVREVRNPIRAARAMLGEKETLMAAGAAQRFAIQRGLALPGIWTVPSAERTGGDTVGCVALDVHGHIAAGVSTGGLDGAPPGRVGDSPLPGCGFYADDLWGGVAATGEGESISRSLLAARVVSALEAGADPQAAVEEALLRMARVGGDAGLIAIDRQGRIGWKHTGTQFAVAWATSRPPAFRIELAGMEEIDG